MPRRIDDDDAVAIAQQVEEMIGPHYDFVIMVMPKADPMCSETTIVTQLPNHALVQIFEFFANESNLVLQKTIR